ncbi:MAG: hypothetical protein C0591_11900 [Marinilabiliales bacterium]|nr:MAG: hypothetical protein C0591_11900 [Marinilabiliales bacterium]
MDTIPLANESQFDNSSIWLYAGILALLVALYFVRKYLYRLDVYLNKKTNNPEGFIGKPWHITWSLVLGIIFLLTQVLSSGASEDFNQKGLYVFTSDPHPWHWFWLVVLLTEIAMFAVVTYRSIQHFVTPYGILRSMIIIVLMGFYFWAGMYMGLIFAATVALFIIYKVFKLFYGRKKGLLTS